MGRPKSDSGETPKRNIRVPDKIWEDAKAEAKREDRTITDVIVGHLQRYAAERRARRRAQQPITITDDAAALMRKLVADRPGGSVFPPRTTQLRTFIAPGHNMVMLDSNEVSGLLRALAASYRAPLHQGVAQDLEQLADALDMQALQALDEQQRGDT